MNETNISRIVSATADRLSHRHIQFSESMRNELRDTIGAFTDEDFKNGTEGLITAIYVKLIEYAVPDITAYGCACKWSGQRQSSASAANRKLRRRIIMATKRSYLEMSFNPLRVTLTYYTVDTAEFTTAAGNIIRIDRNKVQEDNGLCLLHMKLGDTYLLPPAEEFTGNVSPIPVPAHEQEERIEEEQRIAEFGFELIPQLTLYDKNWRGVNIRREDV